MDAKANESAKKPATGNFPNKVSDVVNDPWMRGMTIDDGLKGP